MVYDQPDMEELERMIGFCRESQYLFIYGCEEKQLMLNKYLFMCGIRIDGFVITDRAHFEFEASGCSIYELHELEEKGFSKKDVSFLLALPGSYYNDVLCRLQKAGYQRFFFMSEYNKRTIAYKMRPRSREQFWVEVNLADHCNLNCQMCDHFAPLAKPGFLKAEDFERDVKRLADLTGGKIGMMKLEGGEPLLNPNVIDFIKISREYFPKALICLYTDGLLLKQSEHMKHGNLWQVCHDCNVVINMTVYPIGIKAEDIKKLAEQYDVQLECYSKVGDRKYTGIKYSVKHPFRLEGDVEPWQFIGCYQFNESIVLREGKLYTCPMIPYIGIFNDYFQQELSVSGKDYLDIFEAKSYKELAEFVSKRPDFCRYCDVKNRRPFAWKQSGHTIEEYVD